MFQRTLHHCDERKVAVERREERKREVAMDLYEARLTLFQVDNHVGRARKQFSCRHYHALLEAMGRGKQARGLRKVDLERLYWAKHKDVTTHPGPRPPLPA